MPAPPPSLPAVQAEPPCLHLPGMEEPAGRRIEPGAQRRPCGQSQRVAPRAWEGHRPRSAPTRVPGCAGRAGARGPRSGGRTSRPPCKYTRVLYDGSKRIYRFSLFSFPRRGASSHPLPHRLRPHPGSIPIPPLGLGHPHPPRCLASHWKILLCSPKLCPQADVSARGQSREGSSVGPTDRPDPRGRAERREPQTSIMSIHHPLPALWVSITGGRGVGDGVAAKQKRK